MEEVENLEAEKVLRDLEQNKPVQFKLGKRTHSVHRLSNWTSIKVQEITQKLEHEKLTKPEDIVGLVPKSRILVPKVISLIILRRYWKIKLFHGILWRFLNVKYGQQDYILPIKLILGNSDLLFFSQNLTLIRQAAAMQTQIVKMDMKSIEAKQK